MTLNVNSLPFHQSYACFDQTAEARITGFRCNIALYLSYLHTKFDHEKRISSKVKHTFLLTWSKVKLMYRFGFICSQISQLLRLATPIYGNERTCDKSKHTNDRTLICRSAEYLLTF